MISRPFDLISLKACTRDQSIPNEKSVVMKERVELNCLHWPEEIRRVRIGSTMLEKGNKYIAKLFNDVANILLPDEN